MRKLGLPLALLLVTMLLAPASHEASLHRKLHGTIRQLTRLQQQRKGQGWPMGGPPEITKQSQKYPLESVTWYRKVSNFRSFWRYFEENWGKQSHRSIALRLALFLVIPSEAIPPSGMLFLRSLLDKRIPRGDKGRRSSE